MAGGRRRCGFALAGGASLLLQFRRDGQRLGGAGDGRLLDSGRGSPLIPTLPPRAVVFDGIGNPDGLAAVIDPDGEIAEITKANNRAEVVRPRP